MAGNSSERGIWRAMKRRCLAVDREGYANYGGRGIRVCDRWLSFDNFIADMGPRPSVEHSLDRIDNDGNYEPGNCRWTTQHEQARNTSRNMVVEYQGRSMCLSDWADELGVDRRTLRARLVESGWSVEEAFSSRLRPGEKRHRPRPSKYKGVIKSRSVSNPWHARLSVKGRSVFVGAFKSEEDAARAYDEAALKHIGPSAVLNFKRAA